MTQGRRDEHSTEFGLWLRQQPEIDSSLGFTNTNVDHRWRYKRSGLWMEIEENRYSHLPKLYQVKSHRVADKAARTDPNYWGFHVSVFSQTNPDDSAMMALDGVFTTRRAPVAFLRFEKPAAWYQSHFPPDHLESIYDNGGEYIRGRADEVYRT